MRKSTVCVQVCLTGAKKAAAAKLALETAVPAGDFPAQMVQPDLAPAVWLLDAAAAAELALVRGGGSSSSRSGRSGKTGSGGSGGSSGSSGKGSSDPAAGKLMSDGSIMYTF
jgi:uncharacterized membrane protein YgcG